MKKERCQDAGNKIRLQWGYLYRLSGNWNRAGGCDLGARYGLHLDLEWDAPLRGHFIKRLSSFCRLIRFDRRGTGLSDRPLKMATLEERSDDIHAVMDAAGSRQAVIFGELDGASMACLFAATYPERTRSLMVWGCQARWVKSDDYPWGQEPGEFARLVQDLQEHWPSAEWLLGPGAGIGEVDQVTSEGILRYCRTAASPSSAAAYERMNADIDIRPILSAISCPPW